MLDKIIIIDYTEGSGGEYFSNFLTCHLMNKVLEDNMQESLDWHQKYFNSLSLITVDWVDNFDHYLDKFLNLCNDYQIKNISIPLHLYKFPNLAEKFFKIAREVRFVKINNTGYEDLTVIDFLRKVYLKKVQIKDLNKIKFRINDFNEKQKIIVIEHLKNNNLYWLDLELIKNNETPNSISRRYVVEKLLNTKMLLPSDDIEINYKDFFIGFENLTDKYYLLCENLAISPDIKLLDMLIVRNSKNANDLNQYIERFSTVFDQL